MVANTVVIGSPKPQMCPCYLHTLQFNRQQEYSAVASEYFATTLEYSASAPEQSALGTQSVATEPAVEAETSAFKSEKM